MDTDPVLTLEQLTALSATFGLTDEVECARHHLAQYFLGLLAPEEDLATFARIKADESFRDLATEVEQIILSRSLKHKLRVLSTRAKRALGHASPRIDAGRIREIFSDLPPRIANLLQNRQGQREREEAKHVDNCLGGILLPALAMGGTNFAPNPIQERPLGFPIGSDLTTVQFRLDGDSFVVSWVLGIASGFDDEAQAIEVVVSIAGRFFSRPTTPRSNADGYLIVEASFPLAEFKGHDMTGVGLQDFWIAPAH